MAKTYHFRFHAQKAVTYPGGHEVHYGQGCCLASEQAFMTFKEALAYLPEFSKKTPGPHLAYITTLYDRRPPGFSKATTRILKETP